MPMLGKKYRHPLSRCSSGREEFFMELFSDQPVAINKRLVRRRQQGMGQARSFERDAAGLVRNGKRRKPRETWC